MGRWNLNGEHLRNQLMLLHGSFMSHYGLTRIEAARMIRLLLIDFARAELPSIPGAAVDPGDGLPQPTVQPGAEAWSRPKAGAE